MTQAQRIEAPSTISPGMMERITPPNPEAVHILQTSEPEHALYEAECYVQEAKAALGQLTFKLDEFDQVTGHIEASGAVAREHIGHLNNILGSLESLTTKRDEVNRAAKVYGDQLIVLDTRIEEGRDEVLQLKHRKHEQAKTHQASLIAREAAARKCESLVTRQQLAARLSSGTATSGLAAPAQEFDRAERNLRHIEREIIDTDLVFNRKVAELDANNAEREKIQALYAAFEQVLREYQAAYEGVWRQWCAVAAKPFGKIAVQGATNSQPQQHQPLNAPGRPHLTVVDPTRAAGPHTFSVDGGMSPTAIPKVRGTRG